MSGFSAPPVTVPERSYSNPHPKKVSHISGHLHLLIAPFLLNKIHSKLLSNCEELLSNCEVIVK